MDKKREKIIKKTIKEFFQKMTYEDVADSIKDINTEDNTVSFNVDIEKPETLIGRGGKILNDIQRLLGRIISRKIEERIFVDMDINRYKEKKIRYLKESANNLADEVAITKKEKALMPMSSFDRRIIHLTLSQREDVSTKSEGEGEERRVVIVPR